MILGTKKKPKANNKQYCKGICKKICCNMYDAILPLYLNQLIKRCHHFCIIFLRKFLGKRQFAKEQQAQDIKKYDTRSESGNKWLYFSVEM